MILKTDNFLFRSVALFILNVNIEVNVAMEEEIFRKIADVTLKSGIFFVCMYIILSYHHLV